MWILLFCLGFGSALKTKQLGKETWTVTNGNGTIQAQATVPGGIYTDLRRNGILTEYILHSYNDLNYRWVAFENWTYSTQFQMTSYQMAHKSINLVAYGVDTVADVFVNGHLVFKCDNMFTQYSTGIKDRLQVGSNVLNVTIYSPVTEGARRARELTYKIPPECPPKIYHGECHVNKIRKMQASYGWDWGPAFPSLGIWKNLNIVMTNSVTIEAVTATVNSRKSTAENWVLDVSVWLGPDDESNQIEGTLKAVLDLKENGNLTFSARVNEQLFNFTMTVPRSKVELWWPRGYGAQTMYDLTVQFERSGDVLTKKIQIGIRTVEIVEDYVVPGNASKGLTFYIKINGVPVFAKGSNWIPMDILPEKTYDRNKLKYLLESAVEANYNMLRVWGGGVYESEAFYKLCDRYGLMIWQDLMFACSMYPTTGEFLESVKRETKQQIIRLKNHPSVVIYGGNNENEAALRQNWYGTATKFEMYKRDYVTLYADTIAPIVLGIDEFRPFFTSSPSNGRMSQKEGFVAKNPQDPLFGDVHYYNYIADGWSSLTYPVPRFASEYGIQSLPSVHTLARALNPSDLTWRSDALNWRQHAPGGFGFMESQIKNNLAFSTDLKEIIYLSQINQAMSIKTETEHYRRHRSSFDDVNQGMTMGALYWQLNDVWEAPSWSSIDYHGRWKMLHYYAKDFFADIIVVPVKTLYGSVQLYAVSDLLFDQTCLLHTKLHTWNSLEAQDIRKDSIILRSSSSTLIYELPLGDLLMNISKSNCFLSFEFDEGVGPTNYLFPIEIKNSAYHRTNVTLRPVHVVEGSHRVNITLETDRPALFVWLESPNEGIKFSENGFHMTTQSKTVELISREPLTKEILNSLCITSLYNSPYKTVEVVLMG